METERVVVSERVLPFFSDDVRSLVETLEDGNLARAFLSRDVSVADAILARHQTIDAPYADDGSQFVEYAVVGSAGDARDCATQRDYPSGGCAGGMGGVPACENAGLPVHDRVVVISQFWGEGYFHFMVEGLPRLAGVLERCAPHRNCSLWAVHSNMRGDIAQQMFALFGLGPHVAGDLRARTLLVPGSTPCGGHRDGRAVLLLHTQLMRYLPLITVTPIVSSGPLVVIHRGGGSRGVVNHHELLARLVEVWGSGEVVEHTGGGSLVEQLSLFARAGAVVGPHGAGLSNMLAMRKGSAVVELLPILASERVLNPCYLVLAYNLGLRYAAYRPPDATYNTAWGVNASTVAETLCVHACPLCCR